MEVIAHADILDVDVTIAVQTRCAISFLVRSTALF
jgi:hypothetical protein